MTANDRKALAVLALMKRTRAGNFGQEMSTSGGTKPPQAYARNGGKALKRLVALGYAEHFAEFDGTRFADWGWQITVAGRVAADKEHP